MSEEVHSGGIRGAQTPGGVACPPLSRRTRGVVALALAVQVAVGAAASGHGGDLERLAALVGLVPVLVLAQHRGLRGALAGLAAALVLLFATHLGLAAAGRPVPGPATLLAAATLLALVSLGVGWLAQSLRRQRIIAQQSAGNVMLLLGADRRVRYASPAVEWVLGFAAADLVGRAVAELVHPADLERIHGICLASPALPAASDEVRVRHRSGEWRTFDVAGRNLAGDPVVAGVVLDLRDATGRKRAEEQQRLSQRMQAVGRLAAGTAHDFNNVLTTLQGHVQLLLADLDPRDPRRTDLEGIRRAANRAAILTRQLMAFSRQQVLQPEVVDLSNIVAETEALLRGVVGERVELVTSLETEFGWVEADPGQIQSVIHHLVANARDAMPEGGRITIRTANAEIDPDFAARFPYPVATGRYVLLSVADTGCGMDAETQAQIFEPFFTTKETGQGLGLSAVYGTVKQSGGYIWVDSEVGRGTTCRIYLPRVEPPPVPVARVGAAQTHGAGATVLVVEDDDMVRSIVRRVLLKDGFSILEAHDGLDAIQMAEAYEHSIDLLLTDIVMPEMSGRELARRLGVTRPEMRVIFMSGYMDEAAMARSVFDASTAFLQKPFSLDALARKVQEVLGAAPN